jgi:hypothetical protein
MPLSVNVGLSRKASKDFQSTGVSLNIVAELDQSLLARPDELQRQIADLYAQAGAALNHQAGSPPSAPPASRRRHHHLQLRQRRQPHPDGNRHRKHLLRVGRRR